MTEQNKYRAGAIILSKMDKNNIVLLYRKNENDWSFPKGHIEAGENFEQTMTREVKEETGLNVNIIQKIPDYVYISPYEGEARTKMFLVKSEDDSKLKLEHEGDNIELVPYDKVIEKLSYNNQKEYFSLIIPIIKDYISSNIEL